MRILHAIRDPQVHRLALAAAVLLTLIAAAADAWFNAFSTFVGYDDEGYFLMTTRFFLEGWPLYDDVLAFYGPAYYALRALLHGPLNLPNTNEAARYGLIVLWLTTAGLCGLFAAREARQPWLGIVAFLLVFNFLRSGLSNPGHPEMLVAALLAALPVVASSRAKPRWLRMAILGVLCALVTLTKINAGILATLAVLVAASVPSRPTERSTLAVLLAVATALLPLVLMQSSPGLPDLLTYTALVSGSFALAWVVASRTVAPRGDLMTRLVLFGGNGVIATAACLLAWLSWRGSSLEGLVRSTVIIPQRLSGVFHSWPPWTPIPPHVFGLLVAALAAIASRGRHWPRAGAMIGFRLALFSLVIVQEFFWARFFPGRNINLVFNLAPYLAWVVLVPPVEDAHDGPSFGRLVLVFLACLQLLLAYPIPGSQVLFSSVWLVPLGVIALGDVLRDLVSSPSPSPLRSHFGPLLPCGGGLGWGGGTTSEAASLTPHPGPLPQGGREEGPIAPHREQSRRDRAWWLKVATRLVPIVLALWLVAREARQARGAWIAHHFPDRFPLGLPGTGPLRLRETQVATYRWLVTNLRAHADRTLSTVGSPSLHAWSGIDPPSHLVIPNSLRVLDATQAESLLEAIDGFPRFVLLRRRYSFLSPRLNDPTGSLPILGEFDRRFLRIAELDDWEFQVRRERPGTVGLLDGWQRDGPHRFSATIAPRRPAPIGRFALRDAGTGRDLAPLDVRDESGGAATFDPDHPRHWTFETTPSILDALRSAIYPVVRVEGTDGRWLASLPFPRRTAIVE